MKSGDILAYTRRPFPSFNAVVLLGALTLLSSVPAWSQATSTGSVSGIVTDQQQAAIPGAEVRLLDPSTKETSITKSNGAGRYIFVNVKSGSYTMSVVIDGFATYKVDALQVVIGDALTVNAVLQVGSTSTTIEVTSTAKPNL